MNPDSVGACRSLSSQIVDPDLLPLLAGHTDSPAARPGLQFESSGSWPFLPAGLGHHVLVHGRRYLHRDQIHES